MLFLLSLNATKENYCIIYKNVYHKIDAIYTLIE